MNSTKLKLAIALMMAPLFQTTVLGTEPLPYAGTSVASATTLPEAVEPATVPLTLEMSLVELFRDQSDWNDGVRSNHLVPIAISPRQKPTSIEIELKLDRRFFWATGRLEVAMNNHAVGTIDPSSPEANSGTVVLSVDKDLLNTENNFLQFTFPDPVRLSEVLDFPASAITVEGEWKTEAPSLARMPDYFADMQKRRDAGIHFCIPEASKGHDLTTIDWGILAAQGVALRLGEVPAMFTTGAELDTGMDNLLIGQAQKLEDILPDGMLQHVTGPFLGIASMPGASHRLLIILSGRDRDEVAQAALAFGMINTGFPASKAVVVENVSLPFQPVYMKSAPLFRGSTTTFANLGFESRSYADGEIDEIHLDFRVDTWAVGSEGDAAHLNLEFWAPVEPGQVPPFEIVLNGEPVQTIDLCDSEQVDQVQASANGLQRRGTLRVDLPMPQMQPGANELVIRPAEGAPLLATGTSRTRRFSIFDSSSIELPEITPSISLPDLSGLGKAGFPFIPDPDGSRMGVVLTDTEETTVLSAWTLMAKLSQVASTFLYSAELCLNEPSLRQHSWVIGDLNRMSPELAAELPVGDGELSSRLGSGAALLQTSQVMDEAISGEVRTTTFFTTAKGEDLSRHARELTQPGIWNRLGGDLVTWESAGAPRVAQMVKAQRLVKVIESQDSIEAEQEKMIYHLDIKPIYWACLLVGLAIPFSLLSRILVGSEQSKRRHRVAGSWGTLS